MEEVDCGWKQPLGEVSLNILLPLSTPYSFYKQNFRLSLREVVFSIVTKYCSNERDFVTARNNFNKETLDFYFI